MKNILVIQGGGRPKGNTAQLIDSFVKGAAESGHQVEIVSLIFYGSNSWNYTGLGHIDDLTGWEEAPGSGDVTVIFSLEQGRQSQQCTIVFSQFDQIWQISG